MLKVGKWKMVDYSQITERIYTGAGINCREDVGILIKEGITHIIDARAEYDDVAMLTDSHPSIQYLWNPTADDGDRKSPEWFGKAIDFALNALPRPGNCIYCHCAAGVNRGPSLTYAILRALGYSKNEAFDTIKLHRPQAMIAYKADADTALRKLGWTPKDKLIGMY